MDSYGKFMELAMNPKETGAYLRQSVFYFKEKVNVDLTRRILIWISLHYIIERQWYVPPSRSKKWLKSLFPSQVKDLPTQLEKMDELCHLPGFRHDAKLIEETGKIFTWTC